MSAQVVRQPPKTPMSAASKITKVVNEFFLPLADGFVPTHTPLTSSPDAEGTLGGLVATGRELERHIDNALELARLCSNDPVCAHHAPDNASGELTLQGAACHGCLLISETSCERQNTWLDRALVVPTLTHRDTAFFRDW